MSKKYSTKGLKVIRAAIIAGQNDANSYGVTHRGGPNTFNLMGFYTGFGSTPPFSEKFAEAYNGSYKKTLAKRSASFTRKEQDALDWRYKWFNASPEVRAVMELRLHMNELFTTAS